MDRNFLTYFLVIAAMAAAGCRGEGNGPPDSDTDAGTPGNSGSAWSKRFGSTECDRGDSLAVEPSGNIALAGVFERTADFGTGPLTSNGSADVVLASYDRDGKPLFSRNFGSGGEEGAPIVAAGGAGTWLLGVNAQSDIDLGGGLLVNSGASDVAIAKIDASGVHVWSKMWGNAGTQALTSMAADPAGAILLAGIFEGSFDFGAGMLVGAGGLDLFATKLDESGNALWSKRFGGPAEDGRLAVAVDGSGHVILAGAARSAVDFGGGPITLAGGMDAVLVKLDAAGAHLWTRSFGDAADQAITGVAVDKDDKIFISGLFEGTIDLGSGVLTSNDRDLFAAKLDPDGVTLWSRRFDITFAEWDSTEPLIASDASGGLFATGTFRGSVDFGGGVLTTVDTSMPDVYAVRLDASGDPIWSKAFGDAQWQYAGGAGVDATGSAVLGGSFYATMDFGQGPLGSAGLCDIYLARILPP